MTQKLYATPKMVKEFRERRIIKDGEMPDFIETLKLMKNEGALSSVPIEMPFIDAHMSKKDFMEAYDQIPFEVNNVMEIPKNKANNRKQGAMFQNGHDVVCVQHFHDYGYFEQPVANFFAITYMYEGKCDFIFNGEHVEIKSGDLMIVTPRFGHSTHTYPGAFAFEALIDELTFNIVFNDFIASPSRLSDFFGNAIISEQKNYCILHGDEDDSESRFYLQAFAYECSVEEVYSNTCAVSLMKLFLGRMFRKYADTMEIYHTDFHKRNLDAESIHKYIRTNYKDVTLEQTAQYFHYNQAYLSRLIHERFGKSFRDLVTSYKIDHAQEYLKNTDKHISDIALLAGYDSADHFSRMFRKYTGMSPAAYRKSIKTNSAHIQRTHPKTDQ